MTRLDPVWATAAELSAAYTERTLSPVDAVEVLLERIRKRDGVLHAYIAVHEADARLAAEGADKAMRSGHRVGPLHGVPIALKDLVDMKGRVTTGASKVWKDRVSTVTASECREEAGPPSAPRGYQIPTMQPLKHGCGSLPTRRLRTTRMPSMRRSASWPPRVTRRFLHSPRL